MHFNVHLSVLREAVGRQGCGGGAEGCVCVCGVWGAQGLISGFPQMRMSLLTAI